MVKVILQNKKNVVCLQKNDEDMNKYSFIDENGEVWWRIVGLAKELGKTEMCIRNWMEQGLVERKDVEGDPRPRVRLAAGVEVQEGRIRGMLIKK